LIRFFVFLGSLLVIALLAALFAPPFIDWNQYKTRFETEASRVLGLPVTVDGDTSVRLLPLPSFTFTDMKVGQTSDGVPLIKAESFTMNVELAPLMKGDVVIVDIQLQKPVIDARLDKEGNIEWPEIKQRSRIEIDQEDVALENIGINGGVLRLRDERYNREFLVRNINAQASARTLRGPWRGQGTVTYNNEKARLRLSTGRWQDDQSLSIKLFSELQSQPYDLSFEGPLRVVDGNPNVTGIVTVKPMPKQSAEDAIAFRRPDAGDALPVRLESDVTLAVSGATFPAYKMDIGSSEDPYSLTGSADIRFDEVVSMRANAEGQQIDLKRFQEGQAKNDSVGQSGLSSRIAAASQFLKQLPRMPDNSTISLFLPAVVAGDTVIRDVGVDLRPLESGKGWFVGNLSAQMPGRTDLRADGELLVEDDVNFKGDVVVASRQPSGLAKWLGVEASQTIRDMTGTGFSGNVDINSKSFETKNLELVIDGKSLKGSVSYGPQNGGENALSLKLAGDEANFDQLDALARLITNDATGSGLIAQNIDLDLNAEKAVVSGAVAQNVQAKLQRSAQSLKIEKITIGDLAGAEVTVSGAVENLLSTPSGKIDGRVVSQDPSQLLNLINTRLGGLPELNRLSDDPALTDNTDLKFALSGAGPDKGLSLIFEGTSGGSEIDANLSGVSFAGAKATSEQSFKLVLVNPEASKLMLQLGVPVVPLDQTGRAAFRVSGIGNMASGFETESALTLKSGYVSAAGNLKPKLLGDSLALDGGLSVSGEISDLDSVILMSGLPVPGYGDGGTVKFTTELSVSDATYTFDKLSTQISDHLIEGELVLKTDQLPRPVLTGQLSATSLDAESLRNFVHTGDVDVAADIKPKPLLAGLDGNIELKVNELRVTTQPPVQNVNGVMNLRDGDMRFNGLQATWLGGQLSGQVSLAQNERSATTNGALQLKAVDAQALFKLAKLPQKLIGELDLSFNFDGANSKRDSVLRSLSGGGEIRISNGVLEGVNSGAFGPILVSSDGVDDKALPAAAGRIISDGVFHKSFAFGQGNFAFALAEGELRINSIELGDKDLKLSGKASYAFGDQTAKFESRLNFASGKDALAGAEPEIFITAQGPADNLDVSTDTTFFETYLGLRLSERREREFLAQRAEILERQRLTRTARVYALREEAERIAEAERLRLEQLKIEEEKRRKADEIRRLLEEEKKAQIEAEEAAKEAAAEAKRLAEQEKQIEALRERANRAAERLQLNFEDDPLELDEVPADN
jgi:hypothetical protein